MTLAQFIKQNIGEIVSEWELRSAVPLAPDNTMTALMLRDYARQVVLAIANDIEQGTTRSAEVTPATLPHLAGKESAATTFGALFQLAGHDLLQLADVYRTLRACVMRSWAEQVTGNDESTLNEAILFQDSVDLALAESMARHNTGMAVSRNTFLSMLGHDLRTPLSAISMGADYLSVPGTLEGKQQQAVTRIKISATRMSAMIRDLLTFTKTQLGRAVPIAPKAIDLGQVCEAALDEIQVANPECRFEFQKTGELQGNFDGPRLHQAMSNLLHNAVLHSGKDAVVSFTVRGEPESVSVEVKHSGVPLPLSAQQMIFNPLVQVPYDESDAAAGIATSLGLGLYIAREILVAHGGSIEVKSGESQATAFTARIPRADIESRSSARPGIEADAASGSVAVTRVASCS